MSIEVKEYITGLGRNQGYDLMQETHLYQVVNSEGSSKTSTPLCSRGFNRYVGSSFSIFRGNCGSLGVCQVCEGRAAKNKPGLRWKRSRKLKKKIERLERLNNGSPLLPGLPLIPEPHYFPVELRAEE